MFYRLKRDSTAIVVAISMLAGCGEDYVYDEAAIAALKSHDGEFRLDEVFEDPQWTHICHIRDYQQASYAVSELGVPKESFEYLPRDYYMDEGHVGLALVDLELRKATVYPIRRSEISRFNGPECLTREVAGGKLVLHPNSLYGDSWSLTFVDLEALAEMSGGDYYDYDKDVIGALQSRAGKEFHLDEVFGDRRWTRACRLRHYERASDLLAEFGDPPKSYEYVPRDYYIDQDHVGVALIDENLRKVEVFPFHVRAIHDVSGRPQCLSRRHAYAKVSFAPDTPVDGDRWFVTFIDPDTRLEADRGD